MKHFAAIALAAALLCALLSGCAGTNYGYGYGYDGNVSTTDNGYVNGTNQGTGYANGTNGTNGLRRVVGGRRWGAKKGGCGAASWGESYGKITLRCA